ncbi:MAG: tRNA (N(6)-L-threonylcarbamoyladenosine(37)-C(2))-methylthiotransferase MtaB, partial [Bacteroidetes bacterium]
RYLPHCCIGVDVIVGFPGETEEDFLETYHFVNSLDISYLHVFTYSERANTPAATMPDPVPMAERRRRNEMLAILSEKKKRAFYEQQLGQTRPVLFEKSKKKGTVTGFTDNYVKIEALLEESWINHVVPVHLAAINSEGVVDSAVAVG